MAVIYKKLGEIADISAGGTPKRSNPTYWKNGNIPWVKISDVKGKYLEKTEEFITEDGLNNSSAKLFKKGTLLYTIFATIGECAILNIDASTNQAIAGINVKSEKVLTEYLYYFLKSIKNTVVNTGRGVAQNNINLSILKNIDVPLPEIEVQKKIINLLNKSNELVIKRKAQIEALDQLTQSVFLEMFGDVRKNEKSWKASRLEDLCEYIIDCPHSTPKYSSYQTEYACIRTSELVNGYINWESMKYVNIEEYEKRIQRLEPQYGDIVYGREGTFGEAIIIPKDQKICLGQRVMLFRPDYSKCNSVFLWAMVRSKGVYYQAVSKMSGSTVGHVNVKDIKKFNVFLPPLELQNQFAVIIDKIDAQRKLLKQSYEELLNNYNSLMQRAFKGELFTEEKVSNL